jgi:hypothetical protein
MARRFSCVKLGTHGRQDYVAAGDACFGRMPQEVCFARPSGHEINALPSPDRHVTWYLWRYFLANFFYLWMRYALE